MRAWLALAILALSGCAATPEATTSRTPAEFLVYATDGGVFPHFEPDNLTVHAGDSVLFRVLSGQHSIDFSETAGLSNSHSGDIGPQTPFAVRFTVPATYHFHCSHHDGMQGTIEVE